MTTWNTPPLLVTTGWSTFGETDHSVLPSPTPCSIAAAAWWCLWMNHHHYWWTDAYRELLAEMWITKLHSKPQQTRHPVRERKNQNYISTIF